MTLDEAIEHLDETLSDGNKKFVCEKCRNEHIQLRDWLKELKQRRIAHYECKEVLITAYMDFKHRIESALKQFNYENERIVKNEEEHND